MGGRGRLKTSAFVFRLGLGYDEGDDEMTWGMIIKPSKYFFSLHLNKERGWSHGYLCGHGREGGKEST